MDLSASLDLAMPADASPTPGCDADVESDPQNCGACGHRCCGTSCQTGVCLPVSIPTGAAGTTQATGMFASDADHLYVSNGSVVYKVAKDGSGGAALTPAVSGAVVTGVTLDATDVYYAVNSPPPFGTNPTLVNGFVYRVSKGGGSPAEIANSLSGAIGVAVDATAVYVTTDASIARYLKADNSKQTLATYPQKDQFRNAATLMAVDAQNVYYTVLATGAGSWAGDVMKVPKDGSGAASSLLTGVHLLTYQIDLVGTTLLLRTDYEFTAGGGAYPRNSQVLALSTAGGPATMVAQDSSQALYTGDASPVHGLGSSVYYLTAFAIDVAPLSGGTYDIVYPTSAYDFQVDDQCAYLVDGSSSITVVTR